MSTLKALESRTEYTIGWLSALPIERAAALVMLDERHEKPLDFEQSSPDTNSYAWGRLGSHNIVIASLPAGLYGTVSAATTAMSMPGSFPEVRIGLMVGIGAGIPSEKRDIRLGDVVVSQPLGTLGGVIQYNFGKAAAGRQTLQRRGHLNAPPELLLKALSALQAQHEFEESRIPDLLHCAVKQNPKLEKIKPGYVHQGKENDLLFEATYNHIGGESCELCDSSKRAHRPERSSTTPEIHYGNIASGNTLVKDGSFRDELVACIEDECVCFEMEAAGLMNSFPCIAIRGISDYADSHKNDRWQRYAAVTAAAYAKELLGYVAAREVHQARKALDILEHSMHKT